MTTIETTVHPADRRIVPGWELCDRLRRSLRLVGLDNTEVAELIGVRPATVSTWLNGHRTPPKTTLMIWADMTGVDRDWLINGYAIRDSNPEPADSVCRVLPFPLMGVKATLTPDRRTAVAG